MNLEQIIGFFAGVCSTILYLPQVIKTFKTKKAEDISNVMYLVAFIGSALWIYYGVMIHALPIILPCCVQLILTLAVLVMKNFWNKKS